MSTVTVARACGTDPARARQSGRVHMLIAALALAAPSQDPSPASPGAAPAVTTSAGESLLPAMPKTYAWAGTGFGPRFGDGGTGLGQISITYRLNDYVEPEALVGMGLHGVGDVQVIDRFSFGARFVLPVEELRPFFWLALHHEHQGEWDAVLKNPVGTTLGLSEAGVAHYTGAEAGLGAALPFEVDGNVFQALLRVNVVYLPALGGEVAGGQHLKDQLALVVDLAGGLPLRF